MSPRYKLKTIHDILVNMSNEMQKLADFLNITSDFLGSGYKSEQKDYNFKETTPTAVSVPQTIDLISEEIKACRNCSLGSTRLNAAPGEGVLQPLVMVIGEGPGEDEDKQGRPFVGKAGQLLDKMLLSINLSRNTNCFIANVIKCRPPNNRDPYPEETSACAHFLERQILLLKPKFILLTGKVAAHTLLKSTESIGKLRGKFTELKVGSSLFPVLCTYHPSALLRDESYKRPAWEDLKLLRSKIDEAG